MTRPLTIPEGARSVAFVVTNYPPRSGGVEAHVAGLAGALIEQGHVVTVITLDDEAGDSLENGVRVVRLPRRFRVGAVLAFPPLGSGRRIRRIIHESGAQAISTHTRFFPMSFMGVRLGSAMGIPVIHTEHGSGFVTGVSPLVAVASRLIDLTMGRKVLRDASLVVGVSRGVAEFVKKLSGVSASVFPNAIDVDQWRSAAAASSADREGAARLVFVGRLVPGKGWETTLRAAELLAARPGVGAFKVHFCGDGPDRVALERMVEGSTLRSSVTVHGRVDVPTLAALLRDAVLVNPTTLSEGFQTTLIEALACGARIVTRDVPGVRELLELEAPVVVVQNSDAEAWAMALHSALASPSTRFPDRLLDEWSWSARAGQYLKLTDLVIGERNRDDRL